MTARDSRPIAPSNPAERAPGCCDRYRTPAIAIAHLTLGSGEVSGPQALTSLQKTSLSARLSTPNGTPEDRFVLHQEWIVALDHLVAGCLCASERDAQANQVLQTAGRLFIQNWHTDLFDCLPPWQKMLPRRLV